MALTSSNRTRRILINPHSKEHNHGTRQEAKKAQRGRGARRDPEGASDRHWPVYGSLGEHAVSKRDGMSPDAGQGCARKLSHNKKSLRGVKAKRRGTATVSGCRGPGRSPIDPSTLLPRLTEYLNLAQAKGVDAYPLSHKKVANYIGCSHTLLSPKRIEAAPPEFRPVWRDIAAAISKAQERSHEGRASLVDQLKDRVDSLQEKVRRLEKERENLWVWMLNIEAGLQDSGTNVEIFVPDDLRYLRKRRREERLPFDD